MKRSLLIAAISLLCTSSAFAGAYAFNARQDAMGGAGVSSANYLSAPFYNPALLSHYNESDDVGVLLPVVGAEVFDKDDLYNKGDDFADSFDNYQNDAALAEETLNQLQELQGATGYVKAGAGMAIAVPNAVLPAAFVLNSYADVAAFADVDSTDWTTNGNVLPTDENQLNSKMVAMGAQVTDYGISIAREFETDGYKWSVGVTPKIQKIEVLNYVANAATTDFDNFDDEQYRTSKSAFNIDAGVVTELDYGLTGGFAVKNLFKQTIDAPIIDGVQAAYELSPVPTASLTYNWEALTLTGDLDLLAQKRFTKLNGTSNTFNADDDDLQMAGLGAEWDFFGWAQVRAGYRHDFKGNLSDAFTAGLGFSPFGVFHLDVAGIYAGNNEFGGVLQTSFTF